MKVPLHPAFRLTERHNLEKLRDTWRDATPSRRTEIINIIMNEIENYGECYKGHPKFKSTNP